VQHPRTAADRYEREKKENTQRELKKLEENV
jgi:hypothetical protein